MKTPKSRAGTSCIKPVSNPQKILNQIDKLNYRKEDKNIVKKSVEEIQEFLERISGKLGDEEAKKEILRTYGLPAEAASHSVGDMGPSLKSIHAYTSIKDEEINIEAF